MQFYITVTLKGGAEVALDINRQSICKRCKKNIWWATTKYAKQMPVRKNGNGEWISHFTDCVPRSPDDLCNDLQRQEERDRWL